MEAQDINKKIYFLILLSIYLFSNFAFSKEPSAPSSSKKKIPLVQRAYVLENQAIIYKEPHFDADQITSLDRDQIIAVSTRIYRPKNLFGTFYLVFINKPQKIRGYISEVDVIPQFKKTKKGFEINPMYKKNELILKKIKGKKSRSKDPKPKNTVAESKKKLDSSKQSSAPPDEIKKDQVSSASSPSQTQNKKETSRDFLIRQKSLGALFSWNPPITTEMNFLNSFKWIGLHFIYPTRFKNAPYLYFDLMSSLIPPTKVNNQSVSSGFSAQGHIVPIFPIVKTKMYILGFGPGLSAKLDIALGASSVFNQELSLGFHAGLYNFIRLSSIVGMKFSIGYDSFFGEKDNQVHTALGLFYSF